MQIKTDIISFTETASDELSALVSELRLSSVISALSTNGSIPTGLRSDLSQMVVVLSDLFSMDLPSVEADPIDTLRYASRDINLSKILRERGLFRLYRMLTTDTPVYNAGVLIGLSHAYTQVCNPDTGNSFITREEFIGWFCREAKVSRALVFQRMAMIDKLRDLDIDLEDAFKIVLSKPYAIQETLNEVATWHKGELIGVDPQVVNRLATRMTTEKSNEVHAIQQRLDFAMDDQEKDAINQELQVAIRPAIASLVKEVAAHDSVHDAMDYVRYDIANKPEITYRWDTAKNHLVIGYMRKKTDPNGTEYVLEMQEFPLIPDMPLPCEVLQDLLKRLPVKNRDTIDVN